MFVVFYFIRISSFIIIIIVIFIFIIRSYYCLLQWLAPVTAIQEVPGSIPTIPQNFFLEVQDLERGAPSIMTTIGQLLYMSRSETRLRKLKLRLRDKRFVNHNAPYIVIWQQPLQPVLALQSCSAMDLLFIIIIAEVKTSLGAPCT